MSALHNFPTIDDYVKNWQQLSPISQFREVQLSENQHEHRPLVSIITVVFNAASVLEATLESVFQQTYDQIEYILIDGGSTDATLSIIQQYQSQISFYLSEPDRGLYDAMNKGISLCHGQLVGILNAGDVYVPSAIAVMVEQHLLYPQNILTGNCYEGNAKEPDKPFLVKGDSQKLAYRMVPHTAVFMPHYCYQQWGLYHLKYQIASDYDLLCRFKDQGVIFTNVDQVISMTEPRGVSGNYYLTEWEYSQIRLSYHLVPKINALLFSFRSFLTITIHTILEKLGLWQWVEERLYHGIR